jgi:cardiolipin synthase
MLPIIVYFLVVGQRLTAFVIMLIALVSDAIDGYVARRLNQESDLGRFLDPLCDKISLAVILVTLVIVDRIPVWALIIIARDLLILIGSYIVLKSRSMVLSSNLLGKVTGFIFGAIILGFTLNLRSLAMFFLYLSIPAIVVTFVIYLHRFVRVMKGA